jgi:hypothetical protein
MASCKAAASSIDFLKLERSFPVPELHLIPDQLGLAAGMLAVTCPTGLPAFFLVHVKEMQIELPVAKIRIPCRVAFTRDFFRMAGKAECVSGGIVRRGSVGRIIGEQQLAVA